jgi:hypothetical protein
VFFTVCGVKAGESCVIERTPEDYNIRPVGNGLVVQTNHFDEPNWFAAENQKLAYLQDDFLVQTTRDRRTGFEASLIPVVGRTILDKDLIMTLDQGRDVTNYETCQRMIFRPRSGTIFVQTLKD